MLLMEGSRGNEPSTMVFFDFTVEYGLAPYSSQEALFCGWLHHTRLLVFYSSTQFHSRGTSANLAKNSDLL